MDIKTELNKYKADALEAYKASLKDEDIKAVEDNTEADVFASMLVGTNQVGDWPLSEEIVRKFNEGSALLSAVDDSFIYKTPHGNKLSIGVLSDSVLGEAKTEGSTGSSDSSNPYSNAALEPQPYGSKVIKLSTEFIRDASMNVTSEVIRLGLGRCGQAFDLAKTATIVSGLSGVSNNTATTATVVFADLVKTFHQVKSYNRRAGVKWMLTDAMLKTLKSVVDSDDRPVWNDWLNADIGLDQIIVNDQIAGSEIICGNFNEGLGVRIVDNPSLTRLTVSGGETFEIVMYADAIVRNTEAMAILETVWT